MNADNLRTVEIRLDRAVLTGELVIPSNARAVVLIAHGSGSSRFSVRNRHVAKLLQERELATLLMDLLTAEEESVDMSTHHLRFDIHFLAKRVVAALDWLDADARTRDLRIGIFGASTGAAAALMAADERPQRVGAIVSRGGRPDLADPVLDRICVPTLLVVGGADTVVIELNREALFKLTCEKKLEIIPNATHLFEEKGALEEVARLTAEWFNAHLTRQPQKQSPVG